MAAEITDPHDAWNAFVNGLRSAGDRVADDTVRLGSTQRADAFRALLRGLNNQLGRFEVDRERPELVAFNGWREKMLMDNPDFRYWVADIHDDRRYRITGSIGDAAYQSVTVYSASGRLDAIATARTDSDSMSFDDDGSFELTVSRDRPADGSDWLPLAEGSSVVWVRQFHHDATHDQLGRCRIEPLDDPPPSPPIDFDRFNRHLARLGTTMDAIPAMWRAATRDDLASPNSVRRWQEMAGGAAFTEPGIHYLRGSWDLEDDEALVLEGFAPESRYWNVLLYSRTLNSLDHRSRTVSWTSAVPGETAGAYRFVISSTDPGAGERAAGAPADEGSAGVHWLDTEGRRFGLFVFRFLHPTIEPELPAIRRCRVADVGSE